MKPDWLTGWWVVAAFVVVVMTLFILTSCGSSCPATLAKIEGSYSAKVALNCSSYATPEECPDLPALKLERERAELAAGCR